MSRFNENEDNWQYAEGPWNDGAEARIVAREPISACPSAEVIGEYSAYSWRAGWADADMQIAGEKASLQSWVVDISWADGAKYVSIKDGDGCYVATSVESEKTAEYIIKAVRERAEQHPA